MGLIFDLDLTLIDSSIAEKYRTSGNWSAVYKLINQFTVYNGIYEVLEYSKSNALEIAIVSSSPSTYCQKIIDHWNFGIVNKICYHDTKLHKPHPAPILAAKAKYFAASQTILSFGDRAIDVEASKAANVISIGCLWGSNEHNQLLSSNPTHLIKQPSEIIDIIGKYF